MRTVVSYDVDDVLDGCMTDYCELAILMLTLRHYSTLILGDDTSVAATHVPGAELVIGCPWRRCATAQS